MKARSWLYTSAAVMLCGLLTLASVSVYSIHEIRGIIAQLTDRSTPLQIKTTELQRAIESLTGVMLRLGVATEKREVDELSDAVEERMKRLKTVLEDIRALDKAQAGTINVSVISGVYDDVKMAVQSRLESIGNFQAESKKVAESIQAVERSLAEVRKDMQQLTAKSNVMVARSVKSSSQMISSVQQVKDMVIHLKEVQVILQDLDAAKKPTDTFNAKARLGNVNAAIQGINVDDEDVVEVKKSMRDIYQQCIRPGSGLVALKQAEIEGKNTGAKYRSERVQLNNPLLEFATSMTQATGRIETAADQNSKDVDNTIRASSRTASVDNAVTAVTIGVKSLDAKVRSVMLTESAKDANAVAGDIRALFVRITQNLGFARKELGQMKQAKALRNADSASASVRAAMSSVDRIIAAQIRIIESNEKASKAIETVKQAANKELKQGEELVRNTSDIQQQMVNRTSAAATKMSATIITIAVIIAILAAIPLLYTIHRINRSLSVLTLMVRDIAEGEGDLTKRLDEKGKDEFAELSRWFNVFLVKLNSILCRVANDTLELAESSAGLSSTSGQIARTAETVAAQAISASTASEEMSATSADIACNCQIVAENSRNADTAAHSGAAVLQETLAAMDQIAKKVRNSAKAVGSLGERSEQIGAIIGTIEDIADQTNLLALNAAIEAARAGEQGRGFAVVADEVRRLAERTTEATAEISAMIMSIQHDTRAAVESMEEGVSQVAIGSEKAAVSGEALHEIVEQISALNMQINQIATAAEQQTATTQEINNTIQRITEEVQNTAKGAEKGAEAAAMSSKLVEGLQRLISQFKLAS